MEPAETSEGGILFLSVPLQAPAFSQMLQSSVHGCTTHDQTKITSSDFLLRFSPNLAYVLKTINRAIEVRFSQLCYRFLSQKGFWILR